MAGGDLKEWTIMVYMAGENNLSEDMIRSITEIKSGSTSGDQQNRGPNNVDFVVQYRGLHPNVNTRRYYDFFDPKLPFDCLTKSEEKEKIEEKIRCFVDYAIKKKPAKNYALILSGHSDAFQGRTLLANENPPGVASINKIKKLLKEEIVDKPIGNKPAGVKLKILGFDSCVMNTFEIMYEFKGVSDIWVGSQGSIPNYTWDYKSIALELISEPIPSTLTPEYVATTIVQQTKMYNDEYSFGGRSIDISASYLTKTDGVEDGIGKLARLLIELIDPSETDCYKLMLRILINVHWKCQTFMRHQSIDLKDFCLTLKEELKQVEEEYNSFCKIEGNEFFEKLNTISEYCNNLICSIETMVFAGAYSGIDYRNSNGISLFMPWSLLALIMTFENYYGEVEKTDKIPGTGLSFISTDNGLFWFIFIFGMVVLTKKDDTQILFSSYEASLEENPKAKLISQSTINTFLDGVGGHRDDEPRSRGSEAFANYFGEIKNLGTILEGSGDFKSYCSGDTYHHCQDKVEE